MSAPLRCLALALCLLPTSCGEPAPTPTSDARKSLPELQAQAEAASAEKLGATLKSYAREIEDLEGRLALLDAELRALPAGELPGEEGRRLSKAAETTRRELVTLNRNQAVYEQALAAKR